MSISGVLGCTNVALLQSPVPVRERVPSPDLLLKLCLSASILWLCAVMFSNSRCGTSLSPPLMRFAHGTSLAPFSNMAGNLFRGSDEL